MNKWDNLDKSSGNLTDVDIINNCNNLDLDYVLQNNKLNEDTLVKLIDLVDLRTLIRNQKISVCFANKYVVPRLAKYTSKTPLTLTEIMSYQKGEEWKSVVIGENLFITIE